MRTKYPYLIRALKEQKVTYAQLATVLGVSRATLQRRMSGTSEWKLHEAMLVCEYLKRTDFSQLFLRFDYKS